MLFGIHFAIDLEDNPFCDNLVLGFLLSEVKMNGSVEGKKEGQRTGAGGGSTFIRHSHGLLLQPLNGVRGGNKTFTPKRLYLRNCQNCAPKLTDQSCLLFHMGNKEMYGR